MSAATVRLLPQRWLGLPARSAQLRLTLMYSGMFLALGTALIAVIFVLVQSGAVIHSGSSSVAAVPSQAGHAAPAVRAVASQQHSADVARLLAVSWLTLVLTAGASAVLGWFSAGRVLRPLRQMADTARTISAGNLHERLALTGPDDEFKALGDTLDELLTRLEASFAAQRRFVANAAHELRTPLTIERTLLQVALADPEASEASLRAVCDELLAAGRDQERLLEALLTLATSERGLEYREAADLAAVVNRALDRARDEADERQLDVQAELRSAAVLGDSALLERLVANLIDNAVRYNRAGGRIEVETGRRAGGPVIWVSNTGSEIPPDEIERLFEPFQRLERDRTISGGSQGLGLSIVRAIAGAHGATVAAEPRPGGGLVVTVSFP